MSDQLKSALPNMPPNTFIASFDRFNVFAEAGKPNVKVVVTDDSGNSLSIDMTIGGAATLMRTLGAALEMARMPAPRPVAIPAVPPAQTDTAAPANATVQ